MTSPLAGRLVIVTAGGTREAIDPVRYLGNRSSGKMGTEVAVEALRRGARVTLISTVDVPAERGIDIVRVESADEMNAAVRAALPQASVLVMAAAVADYRPRAVAARKLKKTDSLTLELVPTVDILHSLRYDQARVGVVVVGFAAETDDLEANATRKLEEKGLDLVVLNDVSRPDIGMNSDDNEVTVIDPAGARIHLSRRRKSEVAAGILDIVEDRMSGSAPSRDQAGG